MPGTAIGEPAGLEAYVDSIAQTTRQLNSASLFRSRPGAAGQCRRSSYFGRVVARLGPDRFGFPVQTVLRSGRYLTQPDNWRCDHGSLISPNRSLSFSDLAAGRDHILAEAAGIRRVPRTHAVHPPRL